MKLFQTFEKRKEVWNIIKDFQNNRDLYLKTVKGNIKDNNEQIYEESLSVLTNQLPELIDYLQVINSNFMPQEFSFLDYVKGYNLDDYVLRFPTISSFNGDKDCYYKFIQMFINSEWLVLGDISQNIKNGVSQFIYRKFYTYTPFFRPQNKKYQINLFIWPTKLEYLVEILLDWDNLYSPDNEPSDSKDSGGSNKVSSRYIYKNVFHTDIFIRRNYASRDQKTSMDNFSKVLRSINEILSGNDKFLDVNPLRTILYGEKEGNFYRYLYKDEKFKIIFEELAQNIKKIVKFPKLYSYLNLLLNNPPSIPTDYNKLSKNLNDKIKNIEMTLDEKTIYYEITERIANQSVTMQDLMELAEIYNEYINEYI